MIKRLLLVLGLLLPGLTATMSAQAQTSLGFNAQYGMDFEEFQVGAEFLIPFSQVPRLAFVPNFEVYLRDDPNVFSLNADVHYALPTAARSFAPYVGLGLAITRVERERADDTEAGFNLIGGANFLSRGSTSPFFQVEYRAGDYEDLSIGGGIRIGLQ